MGEIIAVDPAKCTGCGSCAAICPTGLVEMDGVLPEEVHGLCIACGHCVAVCPVGAMDNVNNPLAGQTPVDPKLALTKEQARQFIRSRRSVRCFTDQAPSRAEVEELLDLVHYAASGTNAQGVGWLAIQNEETLDKIALAVVDYIEEVGQGEGNFAAGMAQIAFRLRLGERQGVLRSAHCLLVSLANRKLTPSRRENAIVAQATAELYAPVLGLGSCWAGYLELAILAGYPPLIELLNLPEGKVAAGAIMLGHPVYEYPRMPDRAPLALYWAD